MATLSKKTLDGNVETFLLAILQDGPSYGYLLVQELNQRAKGLLAMGEGTVYPVLHRLEDRGLITASWRQGESGRQRKYYKITANGRRCLSENRQQWADLIRVMESMLGQAPSPTASNFV